MTVVYTIVFLSGWGSGWVTTVVSDGGAWVAAVAATVACALAARRTRATRRAWLLLGVGTGLWSVGEMLWGIDEVVLGKVVHFPSFADAAYLVAVPFALLGLLAFAPPSTGSRRLRTILDGAIVGGSLLLVAWAAVLGPVWHNRGASALGDLVSVAYPVSDVVMAVVAILVLRMSPAAGRSTLRWLSLGMLLMSATDVAYSWLATTSTFVSLDAINLGWPFAYLCILLAADADRPTSAPVTVDADAVASPAAILLPYVPPVLAVAVTLAMVLRGAHIGPFLALNGLAVAAVLAVRQVVTALELRSTVMALHAREAELRHLALHDPLTGLANRANFEAQLASAIVRPECAAAVLYIDLDGFKQINDRHGHAAGDAMLIEAAQRIGGCLGDGTLLARLGGDEFVVLVESGLEAGETVAQRILGALAYGHVVDGETMHVSASIGLAIAVPGASPDETIRRADAAMYVAKVAGKARAVRYPDETLLVATT